MNLISTPRTNVWALWSEPGRVVCSNVLDAFRWKLTEPQWTYLTAWCLHICIIYYNSPALCVCPCWYLPVLYDHHHMVTGVDTELVRFTSYLMLIPLSFHCSFTSAVIFYYWPHLFSISASVINKFLHDVILSAFQSGTKFHWSGHYMNCVI